MGSASSLSRRGFLKHTAVLTVAAGTLAQVRVSRAQSSRDPAELTAVAALRAMQAGELTAERYAEALLARARACSALNVFTSQDPEALLLTARAADQRRAFIGVGETNGTPDAAAGAGDDRNLALQSPRHGECIRPAPRALSQQGIRTFRRSTQSRCCSRGHSARSRTHRIYEACQSTTCDACHALNQSRPVTAWSHPI